MSMALAGVIVDPEFHVEVDEKTDEADVDKTALEFRLLLKAIRFMSYDTGEIADSALFTGLELVRETVRFDEDMPTSWGLASHSEDEYELAKLKSLSVEGGNDWKS